MKMNRLAALLVVFLLFTSVFAGCNAANTPAAATQAFASPQAQTTEPTSAPTPQEKVTLMFSWWGSDSRHTATNAAVDFWNKNNPNIQIQTTPQGWDGYEDKLLTELAAGSAPDVFQISVNDITVFAQKGQLLELTPHMDTLFKDLDSSVKTTYLVSGKNYSVAAGVTTFCLTYNKTMLDKLGLPAPTNNETFESLLNMCKQATKDTNGDGKIDTWGIYDILSTYDTVTWTLGLCGMNGFTADGKASILDDPTVQSTYKTLAGFYESGVCPKPGDISVKEGSTAFFSGYTAYDLMSLSAYSAFVGSSTDELDCVAFPVVTGQPERRMMVPAMEMAVYSKSQHTDQALQFLSWFLTSADSATAQGQMVRGIFPCETQRAAIAKLASGDRIIQQETQAANFIGALKTEGTIFTPPTNITEWNKVYADLIEQFEYGKITIDQMLQQLKQQGDPVLAQ